MAHIYSPEDFDTSLILNSTVAVIGYGSQGRAHALNLRDSGVKTLVGLHPAAKRMTAAAKDGFEVITVEAASAQADMVMMCTPDVPMGEILENSVLPHFKPGGILLFAHGFTIVYGLAQIPDGIDVGLVSPKGPGPQVRSEYEAGRGLPALTAVHQDSTGKALKRTLAYAWGIGCARAAVFRTTFREETESDLFGEQAVLCGGIPELLKAGFDTLVARGIQPEVAYFECIHEAKLIIDLIYARGFKGMRESISQTAEWGGHLAGKRVIGAESKAAMESILDEIQSGDFAEKWVKEAKSGSERLYRLRNQEAEHPSEEAGREVRATI